MRNIMALACLCVLWTTTTIHAAEPRRHAVIIGINDYADPAIPDLKYAESDAKAVYDTLTGAIGAGGMGSVFEVDKSSTEYAE
jgi:2C-methyl-D-erythritol 2,4-cyclodiphosphate synthase